MEHAVTGIGVLDKAVAIIECCSRTPRSLAELVEELGLPRATAHRIASALETHRVLRRDNQSRWVVGPAVLELAAFARDPLVDASLAVLRKLRDLTGESAQLFVREDETRVCVAASERSSGLRDTVPIGARLSMKAGSAAHVLIAWSEEADIMHTLSDSAFTTRTIAGVRRRGWSASIAEREPGVASISAPVRDRRGKVVAAISISGPAERIGRSPGTRLSRPLLNAAAELERKL
ncbi:IclR family transcriptional regulator [Cumulibacter manganitolerans]|uniref:IclR family transcriptional regulator n=1 Tax=Cumulibacter manganitolerans TaxID=1884992 RepID=UPI0012954BFA|nr:IclR family transcriptional regulator [Cumulibacter manganitolerans]